MEDSGEQRLTRVLVADEQTAAAIRASVPGTAPVVVSESDDIGNALAAGSFALVVLPVSASASRETAHRARRALGPAAPPVVLIGAPVDDDLGALETGEADDVVPASVSPALLGHRLRAALCRGVCSRNHLERVRELERLLAQQSEYLSLASHEIRTPLSAILSSANILLRYAGQRPESVERFARLILNEGRRLTRLINNLLDLAKIEAGQVEWHFGPTALESLLDSVCESFAALAAERHVVVEVACEPTDAVAWADPDRLKQVLVNLVSNAIKHSPAAGCVRLHAVAKAGGVRVSITDEGAGIPAGDEDRVFARFQQLDAEDEQRGTGLGLTIAREIVERHRGRIWAEGGRSRGACFVVELPVDEGGHGPV